MRKFPLPCHIRMRNARTIPWPEFRTLSTSIGIANVYKYITSDCQYLERTRKPAPIWYLD